MNDLEPRFEVQKEGFEVVLRLSFEFQVDGLTTKV
jgi:hypothetical protein